MLNLPKNIYIISTSMALSFAITSMMVLVAGIVGAKIAPTKELATLPMAVMVIGTATATIPAALIMRRIGRRGGMAVGIIIAMIGATLAGFATIEGNFILMVIGSGLIGINAAFTQQGRFVILENTTDDKQAADGLTLGLMANLVAAFIGPEIGMRGQHLLTSDTGFTGSFLLGGSLLVMSLIVLMFYTNLPVTEQSSHQLKRSLWTIMSQPIFILAAGSAAIGYGVMSLVMTATPISMHEIDGHSLNHTKMVIQAHIVAMFLPSLLSGALLKRGYRGRLILIGLLIYIFVMFIGYSGADVLHYWWALILLGLGWNLIFMTSTALLPQAYTADEKFTAQAANDFLIFGFQALAAFYAGWLLYKFSWSGVLSIALTMTITWSLAFSALNMKAHRTKIN